MTMKVCNRCKIEKDVSEYRPRPARKNAPAPYCRACEAVSSLAWRNANREKARENSRLWHKRYPDKSRAEYEKRKALPIPEHVRQYQKVWHELNKAEVAIQKRDYVQRNRAKFNALSKNRAVAKKRQMPWWLTPIQLAQMQAFYEIALAATVQTGVKHHVDHIIPLQGKTVRGLHVPWNLQVIPYYENIAKSNKLVGEYIR